MILWRVLMLLGLFVFVGCKFFTPVAELDVNERFLQMPPKGPSVPKVKDPEHFSFMFFADIQVDDRLWEDLRTPALSGLKKYLVAKPVDFIVIGGDNTEKGTADEYAYIDREILALGFPTYWCLGNHDLFNEGWSEWKKRYGASTQLVRVGRTSIYLLDNAGGTIGVNQRTWLEQQLKVDPSYHKIISMHYPMFWGNHYEIDGQPHMREALTLSKLFKAYGVSMVLAGHSHVYRVVTVEGIKHLTISALKENAHNKTFARIDISGDSLTTTIVPVKIEGYIE